MRHRFRKGYGNVLNTHPGARAKLSRSIKESLGIRKSMGLRVGRASRFRNIDGSLTSDGRLVLQARKAGQTYQHIADVFHCGKSTVWDHCKRFGNIRTPRTT